MRFVFYASIVNPDKKQIFKANGFNEAKEFEPYRVALLRRIKKI